MLKAEEAVKERSVQGNNYTSGQKILKGSKAQMLP